MTLFEKIKAIYPELTDEDFWPTFFQNGKGYILLQDDSNGRGPYIKEWNHPTLPRPTVEQINTPL